jgi:hypothetical protein
VSFNRQCANKPIKCIIINKYCSISYFYIIFGNENFNILLTFNLQPNEKKLLSKIALVMSVLFAIEGSAQDSAKNVKQKFLVKTGNHL